MHLITIINSVLNLVVLSSNDFMENFFSLETLGIKDIEPKQDNDNTLKSFNFKIMIFFQKFKFLNFPQFF